MCLNAFPKEIVRGHVLLFKFADISVIQETKRVLADTLFLPPGSLCDVQHPSDIYNLTIIFGHLDPGDHRLDVVVFRMRRINRKIDRANFSQIQIYFRFSEKVFSVADVALKQHNIICIKSIHLQHTSSIIDADCAISRKYKSIDSFFQSHQRISVRALSDSKCNAIYLNTHV